MLQLRKAQIDALRAAGRATFVAQIMEILQRAFPDRCACCDNGLLRQQIHDAVVLAQKKGLSARSIVCRFAILDFVFGRAAQSDPAHPLHHELGPDELEEPDVFAVYERLISAAGPSRSEHY